MAKPAYWQSKVYGLAFQSAMHIYNISTGWPADEINSLTAPARRAARMVCVRIAEAWQRRNDLPRFVEKLGEAYSPMVETIVWLEFANESGNMPESEFQQLHKNYNDMLVFMGRLMADPTNW